MGIERPVANDDRRLRAVREQSDSPRRAAPSTASSGRARCARPPAPAAPPSRRAPRDRELEGRAGACVERHTAAEARSDVAHDVEADAAARRFGDARAVVRPPLKSSAISASRSATLARRQPAAPLGGAAERVEVDAAAVVAAEEHEQLARRRTTSPRPLPASRFRPRALGRGTRRRGPRRCVPPGPARRERG